MEIRESGRNWSEEGTEEDGWREQGREDWSSWVYTAQIKLQDLRICLWASTTHGGRGHKGPEVSGQIGGHLIYIVSLEGVHTRPQGLRFGDWGEMGKESSLSKDVRKSVTPVVRKGGREAARLSSAG